ncbi:MAG: TolC family protein [Pseudomonadota bacterium]
MAAKHFLIFLACAAGLSACASAPEPPEAPAVSMSLAAFDSADPLSGTSEAPVPADWWRTFDDPLLGSLVETALANNRELAVAAANIETARRTLSLEELARTPSTNSTASADIGRATRADADVELSGRGQMRASWEADLFGRIAAEIASAEASLVARQELRRDVAVIVAADTAIAYAELRGSQVRLDVARGNADLQGESLSLLRTLLENGRATRLDVERSESQFRTTRARLPELEADARQAAARLVTLTGKTHLGAAPRVERALATPGEIPRPPDLLALGTPEALIRRRPDIRAAEAEIARRLALGEAERARLFPTLSFNADLLGLFSEGAEIEDTIGFSIGPAIQWEGPDMRLVLADIDVADAETLAAIAAYERDVVAALGEVEQALIGLASERARRQDLEVAAAAAERALELATLRFEEGLDDFLDVIDAQRERLDAQDRLEISRLEATRQAIFAYRALGGIWPTLELDEAVARGKVPLG